MPYVIDERVTPRDAAGRRDQWPEREEQGADEAPFLLRSGGNRKS